MFNGAQKGSTWPTLETWLWHDPDFRTIGLLMRILEMVSFTFFIINVSSEPFCQIIGLQTRRTMDHWMSDPDPI
jgi:hypothetical protein